MDPFRFTLRQLQHFIAAAEARTVTAAAAEVHISQAVVIIAQRLVERAVGQQLMVRPVPRNPVDVVGQKILSRCSGLVDVQTSKK